MLHIRRWWKNFFTANIIYLAMVRSHTHPGALHIAIAQCSSSLAICVCLCMYLRRMSNKLSASAYWQTGAMSAASIHSALPSCSPSIIHPHLVGTATPIDFRMSKVPNFSAIGEGILFVKCRFSSITQSNVNVVWRNVSTVQWVHTAPFVNCYIVLRKNCCQRL